MISVFLLYNWVCKKNIHQNHDYTMQLGVNKKYITKT